jgi:dynein heavy chain
MLNGEIEKKYRNTKRREDVKELMRIAGGKGYPTSFLLTDTQIKSESFLEDVNNILNTGEVPNLMLQEDKDKIESEVRPIVIEMKLEPSTDIIKQFFVERVRENLHIALCMSPVGDDLRIRCR